jgi:hypothetical protein
VRLPCLRLAPLNPSGKCKSIRRTLAASAVTRCRCVALNICSEPCTRQSESEGTKSELGSWGSHGGEEREREVERERERVKSE